MVPIISDDKTLQFSQDDDPFATTRSAADASDRTSVAAKKIGRYRIVRPIATGTSGHVYLAVDEANGNSVALKLIQHQENLRSRRLHRDFFEREVSILRRLRHPRIVQILDAGHTDDRSYLAMEYIRTFDLRSALVQYPLHQQIRLACGIGCYVLEALSYAHSLDIVHRDIKPANLLVYRSESNKIGVKLADFGISKDTRNAGMSGMTKEGEVRGTMAFMSPEQFENSRDVGPTSDVYSTAAVLYYFLTGAVPHQESHGTQLTVSRIIESNPLPIVTRNQDLPAKLCNVIDRGLSPTSALRFQTAVEFSQSLLEFTRKGSE